ncbi:MAG TPA: mechanosensitive ion channel domain-containing protein [Terriglobia bacterium]|jgi:small-conductance mechanosensitive channel
MRSFVSLCLLAVFLQQSTPAPNLPTADQTLNYVKESISWYQQLHDEEALATTAVDTTYLNDERTVALQILKLSFDFAKAQAALLSKQSPSTASDQQSSEVAGYSGLTKAAAAAEDEVKNTQQELDQTRAKLQTAEGARQRQLQATVDELQSEINLAKTRGDTFRSIIQFVAASGTSGTSLETQIAQLQQTVPELAAETAKPAGPQSTAAAPQAPAAQTAPRTQTPAGILDLVTSLFSLASKMRALGRADQSTDALASLAQQLRNPFTRNLITTAQRGEELAKAADTSGPVQLEQQKKDLDGLTAHFQAISSLVVPLGRQRLLFSVYKGTLERWKASVQSEYSTELQKLAGRAIGLALALAVVFILAEIWRKATLKYVRDMRRRYQFLLIRRIVVWIAIAITIAFALATEIGSLATFAGLITAGIAVALQNVILAIAGYFFLVGKYGVRVGDRVQISGVTGTVVDIGMIRMHMMELAGPGNDRQPTGRVVVFSNSIVFQPTASFFKQIPGTNFGWHEVTLILSPDSDYHLAEERMLGAVEHVYTTYKGKMEEQHRRMEQAFTMGLDLPQPKSRLRLTQTGLEVVIRYPLELEKSAEVDDQIIRELLTALEKPPKLKLVGSGTPNIQPVVPGSPAA